MVVVDVVELLVGEDVELDSEDAVGRVAVVGQVEEAEVLGGLGGGCVGGREEDEGEAVSGESVSVRGHGEDE